MSLMAATPGIEEMRECDELQSMIVALVANTAFEHTPNDAIANIAVSNLRPYIRCDSHIEHRIDFGTS